jgi:hypothetical protein
MARGVMAKEEELGVASGLVGDLKGEVGRRMLGAWPVGDKGLSSLMKMRVRAVRQSIERDRAGRQLALSYGRRN